MSNKPIVRLETSMDFELPMVPNFIVVSGKGDTLPIEAISEDGLKKVGEAWTEALIMKARQRREASQP